MSDGFIIALGVRVSALQPAQRDTNWCAGGLNNDDLLWTWCAKKWSDVVA